MYCGSIGAEYMHLHDLDQVNWIRQKLETPGALELDKDEKRLLLARFVYFHLDQVVGPSSSTKIRSDFSEPGLFIFIWIR